jgi:putative nucleotidyltransferase with HDIG domain
MPLTTTSAASHLAPPTGKALPPELQAEMSKLTEISSLPEITTRIIEVVEDPKSTAQDMHDIVKNDPALATKILKVVNSAFYGLPAQVASLDRAIIMLGLSAVKNIALAASMSRLFRSGTVSEQFGARDLWEHCIAVAVCARLLTDKGSGRTEEAFVAGLVHDLGLLVEFQLFPEKLKEVADRCVKSAEVFSTVEKEVIGADHQSFGAALATKWKFPPGLRNVIAYHHHPQTLAPEFRKTAAAVYLADTICCQNKYGFWLTAHTQEATEELLGFAGVTKERLAEVLEELVERVEDAKQIFTE